SAGAGDRAAVADAGEGPGRQRAGELKTNRIDVPAGTVGGHVVDVAPVGNGHEPADVDDNRPAVEVQIVNGAGGSSQPARLKRASVLDVDVAGAAFVLNGTAYSERGGAVGVQRYGAVDVDRAGDCAARAVDIPEPDLVVHHHRRGFLPRSEHHTLDVEGTAGSGSDLRGTIIAEEDVVHIHVAGAVGEGADALSRRGGGAGAADVELIDHGIDAALAKGGGAAAGNRVEGRACGAGPQVDVISQCGRTDGAVIERLNADADVGARGPARGAAEYPGTVSNSGAESRRTGDGAVARSSAAHD